MPILENFFIPILHFPPYHHRPIQQHVHIDFCSTLWRNTATHWRDPHAIRDAVHVIHCHVLSTIDDRYWAICWQSNSQDTKVQPAQGSACATSYRHPTMYQLPSTLRQLLVKNGKSWCPKSSHLFTPKFMFASGACPTQRRLWSFPSSTSKRTHLPTLGSSWRMSCWWKLLLKKQNTWLNSLKLRNYNFVLVKVQGKKLQNINIVIHWSII